MKNPRQAAVELEQGVERYASGDYSGAALAFERALQLSPGHPRAAKFLAWVRDLQAGRRSINGSSATLLGMPSPAQLTPPVTPRPSAPPKEESVTREWSGAPPTATNLAPLE